MPDNVFSRLVRDAAKAEEERSGIASERRQNAADLRSQIAQREKERWQAVQNNWNEGKTIKAKQKAFEDRMAAYVKTKMNEAE